MDKCIEWLLKEPDDAPDAFPMEARTDFPAPRTDPARSIGITAHELRLHSIRRCSFCDEEDGHALSANPFTQSSLVLVCDRCVQLRT